MAVRIPNDATHGVMSAFLDLNKELVAIHKQLDSIDDSQVRRLIKELQDEVSFLKQLRRIPARGYRATTGIGRVYLDDDLSWSSPQTHLEVTEVSTTPYSVTSGDQILLVDATAQIITVNLPAATQRGRALVVKRINNGGFKVTVVPNGSDTIDGFVSIDINAVSQPLRIVADGTSTWRIVA